MTEVLLVCTKSGVLKSVNAKGHAAYSSKGSDIVCAALSVLLRTVAEILEQTEGISVKIDASSRGTLAFLIEDADKVLDGLLKARLVCAGDFLRQGLKDLAEEFPENVQLREIIN